MAFKTHKILPQIQFFMSIQMNKLKRREKKSRIKRMKYSPNIKYRISNANEKQIIIIMKNIV